MAGRGRECGPALGVVVGVAVDRTRDHEGRGRLEGPRALALRRLRHARALPDPRDLAVLDDERRVGQRLRAVEEAVHLEDRSHPAKYRAPMPQTLSERLRARGAVLPDYAGRGLLNVPATVLAAFGARTADDPPPLADLDPALCEGARQIVVVLADGLGLWQLEELCEG